VLTPCLWRRCALQDLYLGAELTGPRIERASFCVTLQLCVSESFVGTTRLIKLPDSHLDSFPYDL
jgi:hypothetical protein